MPEYQAKNVHFPDNPQELLSEYTNERGLNTYNTKQHIEAMLKTFVDEYQWPKPRNPFDPPRTYPDNVRVTDGAKTLFLNLTGETSGYVSVQKGLHQDTTIDPKNPDYPKRGNYLHLTLKIGNNTYHAWAKGPLGDGKYKITEVTTVQTTQFS